MFKAIFAFAKTAYEVALWCCILAMTIQGLYAFAYELKCFIMRTDPYKIKA